MLALSLALALLAAALYRLTRPPPGFAPGLPVVPIWVAFLPLFRSWLGLPLPGQDWTYAKYIAPLMARHGAVVIFFGSQWNVLVGCPQAMRQLFAAERDTYHKSGNHKKLPDAVISALTGGNIISETGDTWRKFAEVVRPALKDRVNVAGLQTARTRLVAQLRAAGGAAVGMTAVVQRYAMEAVCLCVFGRDLHFLEDPPTIHAVHSTVKRHIFHPLFLSVPALDRFPRLFPSRVAARALIGQLEDELIAVLPSSAARAALAGAQPTELPTSEHVLRALDDALLQHRFTQREYIDNLKILFIAGHENVQQALCSVLFVLARDPALQDALRADIPAVTSDACPDAAAAAATAPLSPALHAVLHETLRLYPPIPQLINRRVAHDTVLTLPAPAGAAPADADAKVPALNVPLREGTYVGWTAFGTHRGPFSTLWQPDPAEFRPARWGATVEDIDALARKARSAGEFVSFHGGLRACPGQPFALRSLHLSTTAVLSAFRIVLAAEDGTQLTPGGLLAPRNLQLRFEPFTGQ